MIGPRSLRPFVIVAGCVVTLAAQAPKPSFEVVSVKKRTEPLVMRGFVNPNVRDKGVFTTPSTTVAGLIQFAYNIRDYQMIGAPDWVTKDLFEVNARAVSTDVTQEQMRPMVQSLLEDRFKLVVRWEQREMAYFALLPAHADQRLGPALVRRDCRDPATRPARPRVEPMPTGAVMTSGCGTMATFATAATLWMGMPVIDRTGWPGTFDYFLVVSSADAPALPIPNAARVDPATIDPALPSYTQALQQELGLKLERTRGPLEVLVVQSVQQPTEN